MPDIMVKDSAKAAAPAMPLAGLITRKYQPRPRRRVPSALCTWCDRPTDDLQDGLCPRCHQREAQGKPLPGSRRRSGSGKGRREEV